MSRTTADEYGQLRRLRWLVVAGLALGIAGTTAANVLHAQDSVPARIISAWAPLTLFFVLEVITRAPTPARWWLRLTVRLGATVLGSGAAVVSYRHMVAVALRYGEDQTASHLLPIFVDGLVVVMSAYLVDISARLRDLAADPAAPVLEVAVDRTGIAHTPARPVGQPARRTVPHLPAVPDDPGIDAIAHLGTLHAVADAEAYTALDDDADVQDPDPLLPVARALADDLGAVPGRPALLQEIRKRGHKCGTDRAEKILIALRAERGQAAA